MNKLNLMLHCGGTKVDRQSLAHVSTPEPTRRWYPVPHNLIVDGIASSLERSGLQIIEESHGLAQDGARYFGLLQVANGDNPDDYGVVVGIRNSHDKSFAAGLCVGAGVFVCDNLSFSGEITLARKHTRHIQRDLPGLVNKAVGLLGDQRDFQSLRIEQYKSTDLTEPQVHDLIINALDSRVITSTQVPKVLTEWRKPSHDAFRPRNAWSLFNGFTEVFKTRGNAARTLPRSQKLHGILDTACGLIAMNA